MKFLRLLLCCLLISYSYAQRSIRIAGGSPASLGQLPYQVYVQIETTQGTFGCGGGIISNRHILTAAHCVQQQQGTVTSIIVVFGAVSLRPVRNDRIGYASHFTFHQSFSRQNLQNDIAVLQLYSPLTFDNTTSSMAIALGDPASGVQFTASGWGLTEAQKSSNSLLFTQLTVAQDGECTQKYGNIYNDGTQLCMQAGAPVDTCEGDSGGAITTQINGVWSSVGIVSYGPSDCGSGNDEFAVYTRPSAFLSWINTQMANLSGMRAPNSTTTRPAILVNAVTSSSNTGAPQVSTQDIPSSQRQSDQSTVSGNPSQHDWSSMAWILMAFISAAFLL